jgi:hypothetical protein
LPALCNSKVVDGKQLHGYECMTAFSSALRGRYKRTEAAHFGGIRVSSRVVLRLRKRKFRIGRRMCSKESEQKTKELGPGFRGYLAMVVGVTAGGVGISRSRLYIRDLDVLFISDEARCREELVGEAVVV